MSTGTKNAPARRDNGNAPQRILTSPVQMRTQLEKARDRLAAVLPKHLTPERMSQLVATMMFKTPKLQECHPDSILAAVITASSLGLDLTPSLNECFLIPRWNKEINGFECNFQPGYQGIRKLAVNSGKVNLIETGLIREGDEFLYGRSPKLIFQHKPVFGSKAPIVGVYSIATLATGETSVEVMTHDEVEECGHRRSEGYRTALAKGWTEKGPWITDWSEMARKTVLKRHCKSLPRSVELAEAIRADDAEYEASESRVVAAAMGGTATDRLVNRLRPPAPRTEDASQEPPVAAEDVSQEVEVDDGAPWAEEGVEAEPGANG